MASVRAKIVLPSIAELDTHSASHAISLFNVSGSDVLSSER